MKAETILCPNDQTPMNCHAEKEIDPRTREEAESPGVFEEVHECPKCGAIVARRSE